MKVLIVVDKFPTVSETFVRQHITGLIDQGVDVFIYPKHGHVNIEGLEGLKGFESYQLEERIIDLDAGYVRFKPLRLLKGIFLLVSHLFHNNFKYYKASLDVKRFGALAKSLRLLFRVHNLLKHEISVIHAHFGPNGERMAIAKKVGLPLKLFTTFHGYDIRLGLQKRGGIYSNLFAYADGIIAISDYNSTHLLGFGLPEHKLISLPNGIAVGSFKREHPNVLEGHVVKLLCVARLVTEKALHVAIEAVAQVQKALPDYFLEYTIIGDGPECHSLKTLTDRLGVSKQVRFLGNQSSAEVQNAMTCHHLFLLSSVDEALPTVLLEAQAAGMVVLATDVGSVSTVVKSGQVVPADSIAAFSSALLKLIDQNALWDENSKIGQDYIARHYDVSHQVKSLIDLYELNLYGSSIKKR